MKQEDPLMGAPGAGQLNIQYFTDPLCCWSWAFEPVWQRLQEEWQGRLSCRYRMGGMLSGWGQYHDEVNAVSKPIQMGPVWLQAKNMSGLPLDDRIWFRDPPASSYPACVAVKCAALQSPAAEALYLRKLREAVMMEGQNIAKKEVLLATAQAAAVAAPEVLDFERFARQLTSETAVQAFREDLDATRLRGITRFPSLLISVPGTKGALLLTGHRPYEALTASIQELVSRQVPV